MSISEEAERDLKVALMQADLVLKTRQGFWETPRNLIIGAAALAAVAGALGFKLGQSQPPVAPQTIGLQLAPGVQVVPAPAK